MSITELLNDKSKKAKEKTITASKWLLDGSLPTDILIAFAERQEDKEKAICIEAIEFATKQNSGIADEAVFDFATKMLTGNAPRIKWESAKVIGNIAHLFPAKLDKAINNLLKNSEHKGTVVRWASAFALGEILKLKTNHNKDLLPIIEAICNKEPDSGVKKKYLDVIERLKKYSE